MFIESVKNPLRLWGTQKVKCIATHLPGLLHKINSHRRFIWHLRFLSGFPNTPSDSLVCCIKTACSEPDYYAVIHVTVISVPMPTRIQSTETHVHSFIVLALVQARLCVVYVHACVYIHRMQRLPVTPWSLS